MEHTEKLGLVLPSTDENYDVDVFNENFRIIDENIGGAENLADLRTNEKANLVGAINEVLQKVNTDVDAVSKTVQSVVSDVDLLEQGLQGTNANISTISTGLQSANASIATVNTSAQSTAKDVATLKATLQTATTDIATIKATLQSVTANVSNMIQIRVLVDADYVGQTVTCTNGVTALNKVIDSSLAVSFVVASFGEWTITLGDLVEDVSVYYYGIHNVDMTVEPDSVALIERMSSSIGGSGEVSASSVLSNNSSFAAYEAFDGISEQGNSWHSSSSFPQWLQFKFNVPKTVKRFVFSCTSDFPKLFKLQASNDATEWTDLGTYTNLVTVAYQEIEYAVKNRKAYIYYRLYILEGYATNVGIGELQFYGY